MSSAQTCTTQSHLTPALRDTLAASALELASAIKAGDTARVRGATAPALAANFAATESLVGTTSSRIAGESLQVTHLFLLDASKRAASDTAEADFTCSLADAGATETDFGISGLPPGTYAFATVEASGGAHPWLLTFLLQQAGGAAGTWQMAGLYPHARSAGGHDGLWYWTDARARVAAKQPWLAWLEYGEADALLRPAPYVSTTHLDSLRAEQHAAAPPELANGVSADAPLVLPGTAGASFRFTSLAASPTAEDGAVHLVLHLEPQGSTDPAAIRARATAAAKALIAAHPELKTAFPNVLVFVDTSASNPEIVTLPMEQLS